MRPILLDTCAAIWFAEGQTFSEASQDALNFAAETGIDSFVSAISAWEIGMLSARGRLRITLPPLVWFDDLIAKPGIALTDISPKILIASSFLPGDPPRDPMDRIIAATARENGYCVMTRDRRLLDYAEQGHLQAVAC